jgi:hypothetical protein
MSDADQAIVSEIFGPKFTPTEPSPILRTMLSRAGILALDGNSTLEHVEAALIDLRELLDPRLDDLSRATLRQLVRTELDGHGVVHSVAQIDAALKPPPEAEVAFSPAKESQATLLVRLARSTGAAFFHHDGVPYFQVTVGAHREVHRLRSKSGRGWLIGLFLDVADKAPGSQAIADALNTLEALALRGPDIPVFVRIASLGDCIYIDLADPSWSVVEVTPASWQIITDPPVRFRRPKGLLPLPGPQPGGRVTMLRPFVNLATASDFVLFVMVLVAWLRGRGPYPVLVANGEQGSSKSTLSRVAKALIDPNVAPLRSAPREPRDLMIAAANGHLLAFDNLSTIPDWLSDALCRLTTGAGFSARMLYTDDEEAIIDAVRPVILNGIPDVVERQDLVGRSVFVTLPPIPDKRRRDERRFWAEFELVRPRVLGALMDILSAALRNEPTITLESSPRMADFARFAVAAESACPWRAGRFLAVYSANRNEAVAAALDGDPIAEALKRLSDGSPSWSGTASELLNVLNKVVPEHITKGRNWVSKPRQVSDALRRLAPGLRTVGINVIFAKRSSKRRTIVITRLEQNGVSASPASPASVDLRTEVSSHATADGVDVPASQPVSSRSLNDNGPRDARDVSDELFPDCSVREQVRL